MLLASQNPILKHITHHFTISPISKLLFFLPFHLNNVSLLFFNNFLFFLSLLSLSPLFLSLSQGKHHPPTKNPPPIPQPPLTKKRKKNHSKKTPPHPHPLTTTKAPTTTEKKKERKETSTITATSKPISRPITPNQNPQDMDTTSLPIVVIFHGSAWCPPSHL